MRNETEQKILDVARQEFVQKGFNGARMQDIADMAGINKAMLHYYFRSKEKLYHEIVVEILNLMIPRFGQAMGKEGSFGERLEAMVDTYIRTLIEYPEIPFFIMYELSQKQESFIQELKQREAFFPHIRSFLMQMQIEMAEGKIRDIPPLQLFLHIMGMTVFPFMVKPIFCTIIGVPEADYTELMKERKQYIMQTLEAALYVDPMKT